MPKPATKKKKTKSSASKTKKPRTTKKTSKPKASRSSEITPLIGALESFRESSRFELLKQIKISEVLKTETKHDKILGTLRLSDLCEWQSGKSPKLKALHSSSIQALCTLLNSFNEAPAGKLQVETKARPETPIYKRKPGAETERIAPATSPLPTLVPIIGSVEAEVKLTAALSKIRNAPNFEQAQHKTLADFWDPSWPAAPFEQCLTLKQFSSMQVDFLLKKKSLGPQKIAAILGAVENFLQSNATTAAKEPIVEMTPASQFERPSQPQAQVRPGAWSPPTLFLPSHAQSFLRYFEIQLRSVQRDFFLGRVLQKLPLSLTPEEFIFLWFGIDYEERLIKDFLKLTEAEVAELAGKACEKTRAVLQSEAPEVCSHWELGLTGPGVRKEELVRPYIVKDLDPDFQKTVLLALLRSMGACKAQAYGYTFHEYLTLSPQALETGLNLILSALPKTELELKSQFKQFMGNFRAEDLIPCIKRKAKFDQKRGLWT